MNAGEAAVTVGTSGAAEASQSASELDLTTKRLVVKRPSTSELPAQYVE